MATCTEPHPALRLLRRIGSIGRASLLASCGRGGSGSPATADTGTMAVSSIASIQTGIGDALNIWMPPDDSQGTTSYPVVCAKDCEYRFTTLVTVLQQRSRQGMPPVILVMPAPAAATGAGSTSQCRARRRTSTPCNSCTNSSWRENQNLHLTQPAYTLDHVPLDGPALGHALDFSFKGS